MSYHSELDIDMRELVTDFTHNDAHHLLTLDPESEDAAEERGELFDRLDAAGWAAPTITQAVRDALQRGDVTRALELLSGPTGAAERSTAA